MLAQCLLAIRENTSIPYDLVLVDNGSDPETTEYIALQSIQPDVLSVVRLMKNEGFAKGYSLGLSMVEDRDYMVIINNDTIPESEWLSNIIPCFETFPAAGIILPYTNNACNLGIVAESKDKTFFTGEIIGDVPAVCWVISKKCYKDVCNIIFQMGGGNNFFHSDFRYGWAEDILTSRIITLLKYKKYIIKNSFIYHHGSATQNILKNTGDYRADNMDKLGKYFDQLELVTWD